MRQMFLAVTFLFGGLMAEAINVSLPFRECVPPNAARERLDNFCPRLEGAHLSKCCPTVMKDLPLSCFYNIRTSKPAYRDTSETVCEGGVDVTRTCCAEYPTPCADEIAEMPFVQRLIKREGQCCFEDCPPADYWRSQPRPDPRVGPNHEYAGRSRPSDECSVVARNFCTVSNSCSGGSPCPVPVEPSEPSTPSNPGNPSTPGPGTGTPTTPGPVTPVDPGPSTPVDPGPAPEPEPPDPSPDVDV